MEATFQHTSRCGVGAAAVCSEGGYSYLSSSTGGICAWITEELSNSALKIHSDSSEGRCKVFATQFWQLAGCICTAFPEQL